MTTVLIRTILLSQQDISAAVVRPNHEVEGVTYRMYAYFTGTIGSISLSRPVTQNGVIVFKP